MHWILRVKNKSIKKILAASSKQIFEYIAAVLLNVSKCYPVQKSELGMRRYSYWYQSDIMLVFTYAVWRCLVIEQTKLNDRSPLQLYSIQVIAI